MTDQPNRHGKPSRPWTTPEMHAMDARRISAGPRVVRRVPTLGQQNAAEWRTIHRWTRELLREIGRLGYAAATVGEEGRVYLTDVGRGRFTLVLRADIDADGITVQRVMLGRESWTARQATLWLRKRAARR